NRCNMGRLFWLLTVMTGALLPAQSTLAASALPPPAPAAPPEAGAKVGAEAGNPAESQNPALRPEQIAWYTARLEAAARGGPLAQTPQHLHSPLAESIVSWEQLRRNLDKASYQE